MNNNRDNSPELDYYELRRRHEQYKSRSRDGETAVQPKPAPQPAREAVEAEEIDIQPRRAAAPRVKPAAPVEAEPELDEALLDDISDAELAGKDGELYENPNPFNSFIRFFDGVKGNMAAKRKGRKNAEIDLDEAEFDDLAEEEAPRSRRERRAAREEHAAEDTYAADGEDFDEDFDANDANIDEELGEDFDEEYAAPRGGGFKRFMNLFVSRVDEDEEDESDDEDLYEDFADEEEAGEQYEVQPRRAAGESATVQQNLAAPAAEAVETTATAVVETAGMSRRERRELAERRAAEEAARRAAEASSEEASAAPVSEPVAAPVVEGTPAPEEAVAVNPAPVRQATEETTIFQTIRHDDVQIDAPVEEPTREFKPVARDAQAAFSFDDDDVFGDDDEDEEEEKPRMGFFARRRAKKEEIFEDDEDDIDEEDYDDEYDEDDEDEDDERPVKRRGGFFSRRKKVADDDDDEYDDADADDDDYDDDDDEDEEYDEYDDDEDDIDFDDDEDEYDEYDDDDEDEDEYDDDEEEGRSFGHHLLGVLRAVIGVVLLLVVVVIVLNFLYLNGHGGFVSSLEAKFGNAPAFKLLFPCCATEVANAPSIVEVSATELPAATALPTPTPAPAATVEVPDLGSVVAEVTAVPAVEQSVIETVPMVQPAIADTSAAASGTVG